MNTSIRFFVFNIKGMWSFSFPSIIHLMLLIFWPFMLKLGVPGAFFQPQRTLTGRRYVQLDGDIRFHETQCWQRCRARRQGRIGTYRWSRSWSRWLWWGERRWRRRRDRWKRVWMMATRTKTCWRTIFSQLLKRFSEDVIKRRFSLL